jgi:hypothetical protein
MECSGNFTDLPGDKLERPVGFRQVATEKGVENIYLYRERERAQRTGHVLVLEMEDLTLGMARQQEVCFAWLG